MVKEQVDENYDTKTLVEQYRMIVNSYDAARQQRFNFNQSFVYLFSAIVGLNNFLMSREIPVSEGELSYGLFMVGIIISIFWASIIMVGIRAENNKYKIIYTIEDKMPIRLFTVPYTDTSRGKHDKLFSPGYLELALPFFMAIILTADFLFFIVHSG